MNSGRWIPLWVVPALIAMAVGTVWLRLAIVRTTYSIDQTERSMRKLKQEREQMELKTAELRSPRRLEALARTKFGLSQPRTDQVLHVDRLPTLKAAPMRGK
jgi:cell division protein FtsL